MAATERDFLDRLERSRMRDIRRVADSTPRRVKRERDIFDRVEDFLGSKEGIALSFAPQASIPVGLTETTIGLRNRSIPQTGLGILGLIPVFGGLAKKVAKQPKIIRALRGRGDNFMREDVESLLTRDPDAASDMALNLDLDTVRDSDVVAARNYIKSVNDEAVQRLPETVTVYRSADGLGDDLVEVTTDPDVARRFARRRGVDVVQANINRNDVLLDIEGVGNVLGLPPQYMEKGLLLEGNKLNWSPFGDR